jgi:4-hydroxyphenylacetate 3-monooxygenase
MTYTDSETDQTCAIGGKPPVTKQGWRARHAAVETVFDDIGGVVTRVGVETVGEMWPLYDGQYVFSDIDDAAAESTCQVSVTGDVSLSADFGEG